jgi:alkylation response protein AidB-like acyl-CoA dehydrogenase
VVPRCKRGRTHLEGSDPDEELLTRLRFPYSAENLAIAVAAQRKAIVHAKRRETFGVPLADHQAIQWMLADAEIDPLARQALLRIQVLNCCEQVTHSFRFVEIALLAYSSVSVCA